MDLKQLKEEVANAIMEVLNKHGIYEEAEKKDVLTDIVQNLPSMATNDHPSLTPTQTIIAADGRVITLGKKKDG